jgi:N-acetylglucosamine PTS system EIICBA or EIICB component
MSVMIGGFQRLGRALMLPIAVLPVAGLLLRLGQPDLLGIPVLAAAGDAIFANLGLLFAIGVAVARTTARRGLRPWSGFWWRPRVLRCCWRCRRR